MLVFGAEKAPGGEMRMGIDVDWYVMSLLGSGRLSYVSGNIVRGKIRIITKMVLRGGLGGSVVSARRGIYTA